MGLAKNELGLGVDLAVADLSLFDRFVARYGRLPTERDPDYLEMLRMSKYRVMGVPDVQPGKCANCGASKADGRKYIDIGLDIPWYGALFLCSHCLNDVGRHTGLFTELEEKLALLQAALNKQEMLEAQGAYLQGELTNVFEGVKQYLDKLSATRIDLLPGGDTSVESYKEPSKQATGKGDRPVDAAKQGATKPVTGSGSKNLLSLAERLASGS